MTKTRVLIATGNPGKEREIRRILEPLLPKTEFVSLRDFESIPEPEETGNTFLANAQLKACFYAKALGLFAIADDSGLEVDALGGNPGVFSARFSGPDATGQKNCEKLIKELRDVPEDKRAARYHAVVVLANPNGDTVWSEGQTEGRIIDIPHGKNGFGYDPHFLVPELGKTFAELTPAEKDARSHRARALEAFVSKIGAFLD